MLEYRGLVFLFLIREVSDSNLFLNIIIRDSLRSLHAIAEEAPQITTWVLSAHPAGVSCRSSIKWSLLSWVGWEGDVCLLSNVLLFTELFWMCRDTSIGIAADFVLDVWGEISGVGKIFFVHNSLQTGPLAHPASYPMVSGGPFLGDKAAGACNWPPTFI